mgnify:FL=1
MIQLSRLNPMCAPIAVVKPKLDATPAKNNPFKISAVLLPGWKTGWAKPKAMDETSIVIVFKVLGDK